MNWITELRAPNTLFRVSFQKFDSSSRTKDFLDLAIWRDSENPGVTLNFSIEFHCSSVQPHQCGEREREKKVTQAHPDDIYSVDSTHKQLVARRCKEGPFNLFEWKAFNDH